MPIACTRLTGPPFHGQDSGCARRHAPLGLCIGLVALLTIAVACSDDPATPSKDAGAADAKADASDAVDAGDAASPSDALTPTTDAGTDPWACPGGYGCPCVADGDCATGLCMEGVGAEGAAACATPCEGSCPAGQRCRQLAGNGGLLFACVAGRQRLCDPCATSKDCRVFGLADSACLDYGAKGAFCGVSCQGDGDCGEGYRCAPATAVEGEGRLFCVRVADAGAPYHVPGTCPCSPRAIAEKLQTTCAASATIGGKPSTCKGKRSCGAGGLSACDAVAPKEEACNAVDDDCDGQTDEGTCEDGKVCTADACAGAKGCSHTPLVGSGGAPAPCDADGSNCTQGDACEGATCKAGKPLACDDGNACTTESCDAVVGCQSTPAHGKACDDGQACTSPDSCVGAGCQGVAKACSDDKSCTIDVCDGADGSCKNTLQPGMLCDDGDPCSTTDLCDAQGVCDGVGVDCDDGVPCTTDSCDAQKGCVHGQSADGSACDDGNACTADGTCLGGGCLAGAAKDCPVAGPCFVASCLAASGACVQTQRKAGLACDDGDACTLATLCDAGAVCKGKALGCDDGDACSVDSCDKVKGCMHATAAEGAACDDGDACTGPDTCAGGVCKAGGDICQCKADKDCDDNNACTTDTCDVGKSTCGFQTVVGACDDGDACSSGDACGDKDGKAVCLPGKATVCDDASACTNDSCDAKSGCVFAAVADGAPCSDGDSCSDGDACKSGKCAPGKDICSCKGDGDCEDGNACTLNACDGGSGTCAVAVAMPGGTTCTDGDACTGSGGDACDKDVCKAGGVVSCDDKNACTTDSCDAKLGCKAVAVGDGAGCDDGDSCTTGDACLAGACQGTQPDATVSTWAGSVQGYTDAKGVLATFMAPTGLWRAADGAIYIADLGDHRVRKIAADQTVTTVAGDGIAGQVDGKGQLARLNGPAALIGDGAGDLLVLDRTSHLIRKVALADAAVSTLAGSNTPGGFGKPPVGGFADGQGTAAKFANPSGIAANGSAFVIADAGNHRLRSLATDGTVATVAGSGAQGGADGPALAATFAEPHGVAVGGDGAIWVADRAGRRIRRLVSGTVTTIAGDGSEGDADGKGNAASFRAPFGVHLDGAGALLVADQGGHRVRRVLADGTVTTYLGSSAGNTNGKLQSATLDGPTALQSDGKGKLWIATQTGFKVRLVDDLAKACALAK